MREIKFRVWNKNRNMFIINGMTPKEIQDDATQSIELPMMTSEDCVWQQYTGLKDKNGVEIYEGDLLTKLNYNTIYLVDFNNENHGYVMGWNLLEYGYFKDGIFSECEKVKYSNSNTVDYPVSEYYYGECPTDKDKPNPYYEVVGNIFEGVDK